MGYWDSASSVLIYNSILDRFSETNEKWQEELNRYADYRDGRPSQINQSQGKYFAKRKRETQERYEDRPKLSIPLCRLIIDVHAEALAKNVTVTIDDEKTAELWDEVAEHNELHSFWSKLAQTSGTYGSLVCRPVLYDNGKPEKILEFDSFTPLEAQLIYENTSAGRSYKRFHGVAIHTGYSLANGDSMPLSMVTDKMRSGNEFKHRVEYISAKRWEVYLDGALTSESPFGDVWMPTKEGDPNFGENPYGFIPAVLFNGLETEESFLGISDIHHSVYDVQNVNEIWSDTIYTHRMYVPVAVLETANTESATVFKSGVGSGLRVSPGEDFRYANPAIDFRQVMEPMGIALEMALANAKTPAVSVGMGHIFGSAAKSVNLVSGVAKAMEWKPTVRHATEKRKPFARGIRQLVQNSLKIMAMPPPYGQGITGIKPDAKITVDFPGDIVPAAKSEELDKVARETLAGIKSVYQGMIDYHRWTPQRAQQELNMIAAERRAHLVDIGFGDIVDIVMERSAGSATTGEKKEAEEKLFQGTEPLQADVTAEPQGVT
jgi:hypothetical protein